MMSQGSKRELLETIRPRYRKASKKEKQTILDEFVAVTGYHRKYAIRILVNFTYFFRQVVKEIFDIWPQILRGINTPKMNAA